MSEAMVEYRCPKCACLCRVMDEPHRHLCLGCSKVWEIRDVLKEAVAQAFTDGPDGLMKVIQDGV